MHSRRSDRPPRNPRSIPTRARQPAPPSDSLAWALLQAAKLVAAVREGRSLNDAFAEFEREEQAAPDARAAVRDFTWTTLRAYGRFDHVLAALVERPVPAPAHALLLVALCRLERRPEQAHTIVDQAVFALDSLAPGLKGLVNAVLRNFLRRRTVLLANAEQDEVAHYCHPPWWIARLKKELPEDWEAVLMAGNTHPPMSLRVNQRHPSAAGVPDALREAEIVTHAVEPGALRIEHAVPVGRLPGFSEGAVSVQDAGAQFAAHWLKVCNGERVLDACAAPGGKAAHLLESADIALTAIDVDKTRLASVDSNLRRLGLQADLKAADVRCVEDWWDGTPFHAILADVPCSGSGVVRRHPDIKWLRRADDVARFARQQRQIIDALWRTLAPGGRMLYATCSVFRDENQAQVESFLKRHADSQRLALEGRMEHQLLPDADHDGFYYALLRKNP